MFGDKLKHIENEQVYLAKVARRTWRCLQWPGSMFLSKAFLRTAVILVFNKILDCNWKLCYISLEKYNLRCLKVITYIEEEHHEHSGLEIRLKGE